MRVSAHPEDLTLEKDYHQRTLKMMDTIFAPSVALVVVFSSVRLWQQKASFLNFFVLISYFTWNLSVSKIFSLRIYTKKWEFLRQLGSAPLLFMMAILPAVPISTTVFLCTIILVGGTFLLHSTGNSNATAITFGVINLVSLAVGVVSRTQTHFGFDFATYFIEIMISPLVFFIFSIKLSHHMGIYLDEFVEMQSKSFQASKLASLGEISAGMAHEINNPLAIILGNIRLLTQYKSQQVDTLARLDAIEKASLRIEKIVLSLKKFSRQTETTAFKPISLNTVISESIVMMENKSHRYFTPISFEFDHQTTIMGDDLELEQVFVNLLSNAIDAVKPLSEKWVKVVLSTKPKQIIVRIIDSGHGISKEVEEKIFLPFYTTKPVGEGTGLGLSISKGILDQHHAAIFLDRSSPNTCFEIQFRRDNL